jgi:hypothetical protein
MVMFEYEDFEEKYTKAIDKGCSRDEAFRHAVTEGIAFLYKEHDLKPDDEAQKRLLGEALENYKYKLGVWRSHDAAARLVVFDARRAISRMDRLNRAREEQRSGSRPDAYDKPETLRNNHPGGPPRPAGTGKYTFSKPEYSDASGGPPEPAGTRHNTFPETKYTNQSSHPSPNGRKYSTKEFHPSGDSWFTPESCKSPPPPRRTYTTYPKGQHTKSCTNYYTSSYTKSSSSSTPSPRPSQRSSSYDGAKPRYHPAHHPSDKENTHRGNASDSKHEKCKTNTKSSSRRVKTPPPPPTYTSKSPTDFYKTLGISRSATAIEVKSAYRKMSLMHHPDRAPEAGKAQATAKMAEINRAHDVLCDAEARRRYDTTGSLKV